MIEVATGETIAHLKHLGEQGLVRKELGEKNIEVLLDGKHEN
jgi:hypothetical protein